MENRISFWDITFSPIFFFHKRFLGKRMFEVHEFKQTKHDCIKHFLKHFLKNTECEDQYENVCPTFKDDCSSRYQPGHFMAQFCPQTCNLCCK